MSVTVCIFAWFYNTTMVIDSSHLAVGHLSSILLIDKPRGFSSHEVVDLVRRKTKEKHVGHAGTLDPLATGLLVILVGHKV